MRNVTKGSIQRGKLTLTIAEKRKPLILRAAQVAKERGIPISSLMLDALESYLQKMSQSNIAQTLAEKINVRLENRTETNHLINEVRKRMARSLSKAITKERNER